ncbi:MAG: phosphotransferase [Chloroflexi bacterium]|nr:phosphotransferase [Chloroflexota bacterium]
MDQIQVARSFIAADALAEVIEQEYDLGPVDCKLFSKIVRTQDNDHYRARTEDGVKYVARIYQLGKHLEREESDYLFELDWLNFLKEKGVSVSYPIARRDGRFLGSVNAPEGKRYYALFSFARGAEMSLTDEQQLFRCGAEMARIHLVSNKYIPQHERQPMDLEFLVDRPVEHIMSLWDERRDEDMELVLTSAAEAKNEILTLLSNEESTEGSWGPIGGDFHHASVFFSEDGNPTFFNFDLCGYGWRAYDIASFLLNTGVMHKSTDLSEAFFAGYYSIRPLSRNEHAAISPFLTLRRIWLTGSFTVADGMTGHTFIAPI